MKKNAIQISFCVILKKKEYYKEVLMKACLTIGSTNLI